MRLSLLRLNLFLLVSAVLWGCSSANDSNVIVDPAGKHPSGWTTSHGSYYRKDAATCTSCHGEALTGGITGVSCSSSSFNGTSCHAGGLHPVPWSAHNQSTDQLNSCSSCHGDGLNGSAIAPACSQCHTQLAPGAVPLLGTCLSCHGAPPIGPDGSVYPNISAAHHPHTLVQLPDSCNTCHLGGGTGTATHGTTLTVAFPTAYNAKTAGAVYSSSGNCANVSCHGGKITPLWMGGRINPLTECAPCHQSGPSPGQPQANSYYSGQHSEHLLEIGLLCIDCHDMAVVSGTAAHFSGLDTPSFELPPASTMRAPLVFNSVGRSCSPGVTPPAGAFSVGVCHATENW